MSPTKLTATERKRLLGQVTTKCAVLDQRISSIADYISTLSSAFTGDDIYWFRGLGDIGHELLPGALRHADPVRCEQHMDLVGNFRRVAEIKLDGPAPGPGEDLKWMQLAQHYGLGTRLLDWSESATVGLYFACAGVARDGSIPSDAVVFALSPTALNQTTVGVAQVLESHQDAGSLEPYIKSAATSRARGPVAIHPVWNSQRLMAQKGTFTLHAAAKPDLDEHNAPGLIAIPILGKYRTPLLSELARLGVDEMMLFPELEHACNHLKWKAGLA